jgi:hypothetical protein
MHSVGSIMHNIRRVKSKAEIDLLKVASEIAIDGFLQVGGLGGREGGMHFL